MKLIRKVDQPALCLMFHIITDLIKQTFSRFSYLYTINVLVNIIIILPTNEQIVGVSMKNNLNAR